MSLMRTTHARSSFAGVLLQSTIVQALALPLGLLNGIVVARLLGPEGRGVLTTIQVVANTLVYWLGFGFAGSATVLAGRAPQRLAALLLLAVLVTVASMSVAGTALAVPAVRSLFGLDSLSYALFAWLLAGASLLAAGMRSIALGLQRFHLINSVSLCVAIGTVTINAIVLSRTDGSLVAALVIAVGISLATSTVFVIRLFAGLDAFSWPPRELVSEAAKIGARITVGNGLGYLLLRSDIFLLNHFWDKTEVGVYAVGVAIAELALLIPSTLNSLLFAKASARESLAEKLIVSTHLTILLAAAFVPAVSALGPWFFPWIFGAEYAGAAAPAAWVALGAGLWAISSPISGVVAGHDGYPKVLIWISGAALSVNVMLNLWLLPAEGALGAGKACAAAYAVYAAAAFGILWPRANLRLRDLATLTPRERTLLLRLKKSLRSKTT